MGGELAGVVLCPVRYRRDRGTWGKGRNTYIDRELPKLLSFEIHLGQTDGLFTKYFSNTTDGNSKLYTFTVMLATKLNN